MNSSGSRDALEDELFEDVMMMLARARKHQEEFDACFTGRAGPPPWSVEDVAIEEGFSCTLCINCSRLKELKPIAADLCNNLVHALDQLVGAAARSNGHDHSRDVYFPWILEDETFERALRRLSKYIGEAAAEAILRARAACAPFLAAAHLAKKISNSGKHWEFIPSRASVPAVAINRPGGSPQIFDIPGDALEECFYYEFYRGPERMTEHPIVVVVGLSFEGLGDPLVSTDTVFSSAFRYVSEVIEAVRNSRAICGA